MPPAADDQRLDVALSGWTAPLAPVLEGRVVRLEPLREEHSTALLEAARPPEIWTWIVDPPPSATPERWRAYFSAALATSAVGEEAAAKARLQARLGGR